jgi:hypothetical protein
MSLDLKDRRVVGYPLSRVVNNSRCSPDYLQGQCGPNHHSGDKVFISNRLLSAMSVL